MIHIPDAIDTLCDFAWMYRPTNLLVDMTVATWNSVAEMRDMLGAALANLRHEKFRKVVEAVPAAD